MQAYKQTNHLPRFGGSWRESLICQIIKSLPKLELEYWYPILKWQTFNKNKELNSLGKIVGPCLARKIFDYIRTMINILIIFLTSYFQKKWYNGQNLPFQPKGLGFNLFFNFFFLPWTKWMEKKTYGQLLQIKCFKEKRSFLKEKETKW